MEKIKIHFDAISNKGDIPFVEIPISRIKKAHQIKGLFYGLPGFELLEKKDPLEDIFDHSSTYLLIYGEEIFITDDIGNLFFVLGSIVNDSFKSDLLIWEANVFEFLYYKDIIDFLNDFFE
jgi:hypothetical protein